MPDSNARYRILSKAEEQCYTMGVVYEPGVVDTDGDFARGETIRKAAYGFMQVLQGAGQLSKAAVRMLAAIQKALAEGGELRLDVTDWGTGAVEKGALGDMHSEWDDSLGDVVGSMVIDADWQFDSETLIKKDTWLLGVVWSEDYFEKVKAGERTGFSLGGRAVRVEAEAPASKATEISADPTKTTGLRSEFQAEELKRLSTIADLVTEAIGETLVFGESPPDG